MYRFNSRVRYSETDEEGSLTLTGIMNYLQDCSTFQSEDIGLGIDFLRKTDRAWWLSSWQIIIDRYPVLGEEIVIGTWPYDFKGIYGYRNFTICDTKGNFLVKASSVWFFFDTKNQSPVRIQESDVKGYGQVEQRLDMEYAPRKIKIPVADMEAEPILVGKSHLDTNHHVNNAQYVEIAKEALQLEEQVAEIRVEYKRAAVFGDLLYPEISSLEDGYIVSLCDANKLPYAVIWLRMCR